MNNFQQHWVTLRSWVEYHGELDELPYQIQNAVEFMERLSEQFIVLTVTRSEIDDLFGDKVGERLTDGQMTEIAAHMEYNEFLCDEKETALKHAMYVLHDIEPTPEEEDDMSEELDDY